MTRDELARAVDRLRHDLGKYVVFEVAWCGPDAAPAALRDALRRDLLETARGPDGASSAGEIWRRLCVELHLRGEPEAEELDLAVRAMEELLPALDQEPPDPRALAALAAGAEAIRRSCYAWWERTRRS